MEQRTGDGAHDWQAFLAIVPAHADQNWLRANGLWLPKAHWEEPLHLERNFRRRMRMTAGCALAIRPLFVAFMWYLLPFWHTHTHRVAAYAWS
jgi:hypothetical protein